MLKAFKIIGDGISAVLVFLILVYQRAISPYTTPSCGYSPTCSNYMKGSLRKYGPIKGLWLGVKRILRCHPFHEGGYDPVP